MEEPHARSAKKPGVTMTQIFLFLLAVVIAFIAGTRSDYILATLTGQAVGTTTLDLSSVQSLYRELSRSYDGDLDNEKLVDGAKRGMVEAVGDPYTVYFTAEETQEFLNDLEGTFEGIGAELGKRESDLTIISTIDGSNQQYEQSCAYQHPAECYQHFSYTDFFTRHCFLKFLQSAVPVHRCLLLLQ